MEFESITANQFARLHEKASNLTRKPCGSFIIFSGYIDNQPLIIGQDTVGNTFKITER